MSAAAGNTYITEETLKPVIAEEKGSSASAPKGNSSYPETTSDNVQTATQPRSVGPSIGPSAPKVGPSIGPSAPKVGPSIGPSAPKVGPSIGPSTSKVGPSIGPSTSNVGPSIGPSTSKVGPSIGPSTSNVGPSIGPSTSNVGPSIGPSTSKVGPSIGPSTSNVGPSIGPSTLQSANLNYSYTPAPATAAYNARPANSYGQPANSYGIRPAANATAQTQANNLRPIRNWELAEHNTSDSLWIGYKGYVYDATAYKHSGGLAAILRGAGKDATKMITIQHSWVKVDQVLKSTRIGILADQALDSDDDD